MATAQTPSYYETQKLVAGWSAKGTPSDEEKIKFIDEVSAQLDDDEMVQKFLANVKEAGTAANQVDAAFDRVSRAFDDMVAKYGSDFPGFSNYNGEWKGYNSVSTLTSSRHSSC
jgi:hypothetical protein